MEWYTKVFQKYADFDGRARRKEFWMFLLINMVIGLSIAVVETVIGFTFGIIGMLYSLAVLIPSIAVGARRLHDTGRTGWLLLIGFIPLVNLVLLFFMVQPGIAGKNQYGNDPKAVNA